MTDDGGMAVERADTPEKTYLLDKTDGSCCTPWPALAFAVALRMPAAVRSVLHLGLAIDIKLTPPTTPCFSRSHAQSSRSGRSASSGQCAKRRFNWLTI